MASSHEAASAFVGVASSGEIKALRKDTGQTHCVHKDLNTFQALLPVTGSLEPNGLKKDPNAFKVQRKALMTAEGSRAMIVMS